ncbi:hypothetical protein TNCV_5070301 [Trichonephila clavipes]|nr:hypothetical protein TNCV_5070301 [Trichonephila clavipes]
MGGEDFNNMPTRLTSKNGCPLDEDDWTEFKTVYDNKKVGNSEELKGWPRQPSGPVHGRSYEFEPRATEEELMHVKSVEAQSLTLD